MPGRTIAENSFDLPHNTEGAVEFSDALLSEAYESSSLRAGEPGSFNSKRVLSLGQSIRDASRASQEILKLCLVCELKYPRGAYIQIQDNYQQIIAPEPSLKLTELKSSYQKDVLRKNLAVLTNSVTDLQTYLAEIPDTKELPAWKGARALTAWSKTQEAIRETLKHCQRLTILMEKEQFDSKQISLETMRTFSELHKAKKQQIKLKKALGLREGLLDDIKSFLQDVVFEKGLARFIPIRMKNN